MLFDTHTHIDHRQFDADRLDVLARARAAGVDLLMLVGFNEERARAALAYADRYPTIYATVGMHPHHAGDWREEHATLFAELSRHPKVRGLGEVGLDYHYNFAPPPVQQAVFRRQVALARELRLPLVIHCREAQEDVVQVLAEEGADQVGGVMHCFAGDWVLARRCLDLNFALGIGGTVTYKNNASLHEVAARVPLDRLLLETDCPYLAPVPHRGRRNEPAYVVLVCERIAALRGADPEEIAAATTANGKGLFGIP